MLRFFVPWSGVENFKLFFSTQHVVTSLQGVNIMETFADIYDLFCVAESNITIAVGGKS